MPSGRPAKPDRFGGQDLRETDLKRQPRRPETCGCSYAGACYRASDIGSPPDGTWRNPTPAIARLGEIMIILGIILLIIGFLTHIAIVWTIGIIVLVLGLIAVLLGSTGRAIGGRRHYW
jgi:hypothetical protein